MADLAQIAQSGVDPISGSYLSAERRKAIFAKSRNVSSNIFRRGGPLVGINNQPDSGALALVQTQSQTIPSLQEQVNSLRTQVVNLNNVVSIQTQTIGGLQEQVGGLKTEVTDFSGALSRITDVIAYDSVLEQNRTRQEQEEQRRATEQGLRVGRESILEKTIQGALVAPVQKIAQNAQSILSKVAQFFTTLFAGWFANKGIEVLKALSEGNGKKLEEIRDNVLKGLGIAAGTLFLLNGGFFAIAGTITKLSLKIGGWLLKNTVGRFFGALGNLLKSAGNAIVSTAKAGVAAITGTGAKAAASVEAKSASAAVKRGTGLGAKFVGGLLPVAGGVIEANSAKESFERGNPLAGSLHSTSAALSFSEAAGISIPFVWTAGLITSGLGYAADFTSIGQNKKEPPKKQAAVKPQTPVVPKNKAPNAPTPAGNEQSFDQKMGDLTSQASKIDWTKPAQFGEVNMNPEQGTPAQVSSQPAQADIKTPAQTSKIATLPLVVPKNKAPNAAADGQSFNETMGNLTSQASQIDWTKPAQFREVNMDPEQGTPAQVSSQPAQADIKTPAQTSKIATLPLNVGPAPEPTPNVVYKRIGSPAQQQSGAAPTGGSVNEVPAISASNPDNFYVLYSQVNYNVVT